MADTIIVLFMLVMFIIGWVRGIARRLWALAALCIAVYLSGLLYTSFIGLAYMVVADDAGSRLLSFVGVYIILSAVLSVPADLLLRRLTGEESARLGIGERIAAGIVGVVEAAGVTQVAAAILTAFPVLGLDDIVKSSRAIRVLFDQWAFMMPLLPAELHMIFDALRF